MSPATDFTIVGVVGDARMNGLAAEPEPEIFIPHAQTPARWATLLVRTTGEPEGMIRAVKQEIWSLDGRLPIRRTRTLGTIVSESVWQLRFTMTLLTIFAGLALALGAAGIFAVLSYSVSRRRHEIGIRMALGAERREIIKMVLAHGLKLASIGVAIGIPLALALTRVLSRWLYPDGSGTDLAGTQRWLPDSQRVMLHNVSVTDPFTFAAIAAVLLAVAAAACIVPAQRASRVQPLVALRNE